MNGKCVFLEASLDKVPVTCFPYFALKYTIQKNELVALTNQSGLEEQIVLKLMFYFLSLYFFVFFKIPNKKKVNEAFVFLMIDTHRTNDLGTRCPPPSTFLNCITKLRFCNESLDQADLSDSLSSFQIRLMKRIGSQNLKPNLALVTVTPLRSVGEQKVVLPVLFPQ